jgi:hypothetical protein
MYDLHPVVGFSWVGMFSGRMDPPGIEGTGGPFTFCGSVVTVRLIVRSDPSARSWPDDGATQWITQTFCPGSRIVA